MAPRQPNSNHTPKTGSEDHAKHKPNPERSRRPSIWTKNYLLIIGTILLIVGILAFVLPIFSYTSTDQLIDLGPFQATSETKRHLEIPAVAAIIFLGVGVLFSALGLFLKKKH